MVLMSWAYLDPWSQVGHMLQLNRRSSYLNVVLANLSMLVDSREMDKTAIRYILLCSISQDDAEGEEALQFGPLGSHCI